VAGGVVLVVGSGRDGVIRAIRSELLRRKIETGFVDEDDAGAYAVVVRRSHARTGSFNVRGGDCVGHRPVIGMFLRHTHPSIRGAPMDVDALARLQLGVDEVADAAKCPVVNRPRAAVSNYSKFGQVVLLARAGFSVPRTLVTSIPEEARAFLERHGGRAILKGASNVPTLASLIDRRWVSRLRLVRNCPVLLQEYIPGDDVRVHVIGDTTVATRLVSRDEDYRRALRRDPTAVRVEPTTLSASLRSLAVRVTRRLGLMVAGLDFKRTREGRLVCLELNPYPQFTFYERAGGQVITRKVVDLLLAPRPRRSVVFA